MVEINASNFKLRPFSPKDAEIFHLGINTSRIERDTTIPLPWEMDHILWWIGFINEAATRTPLPEIHFVIEVQGSLAGSIGIINVDGHKAEIGYWLREEYASKGVMSEAIGLVSEFAFKVMGLKRLFAPVLTHNIASSKVLEKNGYIMEGILQKFYFKNGEYINAFCYAKISD